MVALAPASVSSDPQEVALAHRILIVEDEESIRETLALSLKEEGYEVHTTGDGREALALLQQPSESEENFTVDLIILDIMLPNVNGLDVCRSLRFAGNHTPILIVSAKDGEMEKVTGLEVGADDYITKPFSMKELIARCRAMIRRQELTGNGGSGNLNCRRFGDLALYPQECRVLVRGEEITLAPKEFRLLELFMSYPRRVWSREQLIEQIWGIDFMGDSKTVDVHIRWLREKIERDPSQPEYLITVRGFGYRFG